MTTVSWVLCLCLGREWMPAIYHPHPSALLPNHLCAFPNFLVDLMAVSACLFILVVMLT